eukprot:SAG11_NODE_12308_length_710_cov_0.662848_1_plen_36_part_01
MHSGYVFKTYWVERNSIKILDGEFFSRSTVRFRTSG